MADPLPAHKRAEILVRVAGYLGKRHDEVAQTICAEAGKPMKAARVEAARAMSTYTFAAVEARKLAGDVVPMDASQAGVGKLAFTLRRPIGVVGAISPFNFPLNLVAHKIAPALAAGCAVVLKPAVPDAAVGAAARRARARGGPAPRLAQRPHRSCRRDRRRARRGRAREADHVHRLVRGRLEAPRARGAQEGRARARQCDAGDRRGRRRHRRGGVEARRERVRVRRPELHLRAADLRPARRRTTPSSSGSSPASRRSRPVTRPTRRPTSGR